MLKPPKTSLIFNRDNRNYAIALLVVLGFIALSLVDFRLAGLTTNAALLNVPLRDTPLTIQDVLKAPADSWAIGANNHVFINWQDPAAKMVHWTRQTISNSTTEPREFTLEFPFAPISRVEFYTVENGVIRNVISMTHEPSSEPATSKHDKHLYGVTVNVSPHSYRDIYIKTESLGLVSLSLVVLEGTSYKVYDTVRIFGLGMFYGGMLSLLFYNLIVFLTTRQRVYIFYVAYQLAAALYHYQYDGFGYIFPIQQNFALSSKILQIALVCAPMFATLFIDSFLELKNHDRILRKFVLMWHIIGLLAVGLVLVVPTGVATLLAVSYICLSSIGLAITLGIVIKKLEVYSFFIAWAGAVVSAAIASYSHFGLWTGNIISLNITHVGILWEALFLSMALGERLNRQRIAQEKLQNVVAGKVSPVTLNDIADSSINVNYRMSKREVTMMFVDIAHFSRISIRLGPQKTFQALSAFMQKLAKIVELRHGRIDRSLGDGALIIFGYEANPGRDHSLEALLAAIEIQKLATETTFDGAIMPCRIGINRGEVIIGNLGGTSRFDFTVVGDAVNFTSRLESACNNFKIMLSQETGMYLQGLEPSLNLVPVYLKVKHSDDFIQALEFDPFMHKSDFLRQIELQYFKFLNQKLTHPRIPPPVDLNIKLISTVTCFVVHDMSLDGFGVVAPCLVGRSVIFQVTIETDSDLINRRLSVMSLNKIDVEVRWGRQVDKNCLHGLKIIGLNDELRQLLFDTLTTSQTRTAFQIA